MSKTENVDATADGSHGYQAHPLRIQRTRKAGYKLPSDAVYVGRPTKWGNPYRPDQCSDAERGAVECFRILVESEPETISDIQAELRGKRLACWCSLDKPCHDAFGQASVYEMAETLWCVYLCRCDLFASFDVFLSECIRKADFFRKQKGK